MSAAFSHPARPAPAASDQASNLRAMLASARPSAPPVVAVVRAPAAPAADRRARVRRARVVTVSSGKGGVGKTVLCVNLAIALAQAGRRVALVDADLGMANADVLCGLTPVRRLEEVVLAGSGGVAALADIAVDAPGGFRLVPGAVGVARMAAMGELERARLMGALAELERQADVVIVDTGAGLGPDVLHLMREADEAIVVATPEPTSIADAYALLKCAVQSGAAAASLGLVINQAAGEREATAVHARIAGVAARFLRVTPRLAGWVRADPAVPAAVRRRRPLLIEAPRARVSDDVRRLGEGLLARASAEERGPAVANASGADPVPVGMLGRLFGVRRLDARCG